MTMKMEFSATAPQPVPSERAVRGSGASCDGLLYTVFQQLRASSNQGVAVALTSANSGEGVTHCLRSLVDSLSRDSSMRTLQIDSRRLRDLSCTPSGIAEHCVHIEANISEFLEDAMNDAATPAQRAHSWEGNWEYRRDCLAELRGAYDYILIDCPALKEGRDVFSLAPLVDGVILVVEASKTRTEQILHAERSIDFARGKLIGHILNKRTFTVPEWLYKRL